jgi:hypothetical protein
MLGPTSSEVTPAEEEEWTIPARKRRRDKGKDLLLPGKKRKASGAEGTPKADTSKDKKPSQESAPTLKKDSTLSTQDTNTSSGTTSLKVAGNAAQSSSPVTQQTEIKVPVKPAAGPLGLVAYGSDSDSE